MSAGSMLAALHARAVTAIAGRSSGGVQTASLQCFISISKFVDLYFSGQITEKGNRPPTDKTILVVYTSCWSFSSIALVSIDEK